MGTLVHHEGVFWKRTQPSVCFRAACTLGRLEEDWGEALGLALRRSPVTSAGTHGDGEVGSPCGGSGVEG